MSNPQKWRAKPRTAKPNSRQKRNGLFLDSYPTCQVCGHSRSREAHHDLPKGHPNRFDWQRMKALCRSCHVGIHQQAPMVITIQIIP